MQLFLHPDFSLPELSEQRESVIAFARYCLPQVFFYGMFVLVGQILNARGRFGPMMWAPIANNVIAIAVLVVYLVVFGPAEDLFGGFTPQQELLLGLGSTAGIVAQFLILVPYLRSVGYSLPRHASTSATPAWATPCAWGCGRCCSSSSTRSPTPSWCGWPREGRRARPWTPASRPPATPSTPRRS